MVERLGEKPSASIPVGQGSFTRYTNWDWDDTQDQLIAGQQTALGLSIQGISATQLQTLQTRMEATKATLQQAQAAPEGQRASILQNLTGDHLTGDLLTATIWGYFAALQSHGSIASSQAHMYDRPALSYGLFHAQVKANKLFRVVTTGITFQGLNMDIGHVRHNRWVLNDDPKAAINTAVTQSQTTNMANTKTAAHSRWIVYNKLRGQMASALEHAVPEQFWVDKSQCRYADETGAIKNPTQADCAQAVSAVKAIAIAQQQGQRIYTITPENAATALLKLPIGGTVGEEVRAAVQAGKEVTIHESPITAHGWTGYGYAITDPETGAGAYIIEGKGNGGNLLFQGMAALFGLIASVSNTKLAGLLKLFPVVISIHPFVKLAVGFFTLVGALISDDPYKRDATSFNLELILLLTNIGLMTAPIYPVLFALILIVLMAFVGFLIGNMGMLLFSRKNNLEKYV